VTRGAFARPVRSCGALGLLVAGFAGGCGWNPSRPFDRDAPVVTEAIFALDAGDAAAAAQGLEDYLSTGACKDGNIGAPDLLKRRPDGTLDLGLALFRLGETYGRRFGEEEEQGEVDESAHELRHAQVECSRHLLEAIEDDETIDAPLRARARYLEGNLAFLEGEYEQAVNAYDRALKLAPGEADGGDPVGRDAAWNRAIALRRIDDKKDAGQDASPPPRDAASGDSGSRTPNDAGSPGERDASQGPRDAGGDKGPPDAGPPPSSPDAGVPPPDAEAPPPVGEDERMLDQLENAPTFQQQEAKRTGKHPVRGMEDK
jgi:tetratricopeptide (TPR) repeat protein